MRIGNTPGPLPDASCASHASRVLHDKKERAAAGDLIAVRTDRKAAPLNHVTFQIRMWSSLFQ